MKCGCEGSECPICHVGMLIRHKCDRCRARFCPQCHRVANLRDLFDSDVHDLFRGCLCYHPKYMLLTQALVFALLLILALAINLTKGPL